MFETHPELVVARLAGAPLRHNKKTLMGRRERAQLLRRVFPSGLFHPTRIRLEHGLRHVMLDDVADAYVLAYAARCIHEGSARRVPQSEPARDARGLRMEIWF